MSERQATPRPKAGHSNQRRDGSTSRTRADIANGSSSQVSSDERAREMYRLRIEEQLTLKQIGQRFGIGAERTRQILKRYCHTHGITYPSRVKHQSR